MLSKGLALATENFQRARVYLIKMAWIWRNRSQNFIYHIQNK